MKIISVYNNKGGTAKTTSVFNFAGILAKQGKKVLCVDTDPQGNLSRRLLTFNMEQKTDEQKTSKGRDRDREWFKDKLTIADIFREPEKVNEAIISCLIPLNNTQPKKRGIDIIPSVPFDLAGKEEIRAIDEAIGKALPKGNFSRAMRSIRRTRKHLYDYDYILIDYGPTYGNITKEALTASDYLVTPSTIDVNSVDGMDSIMAIKNEIKKTNPGFKFLGFYLCCWSVSANYDKSMEKIIEEKIGKYNYLGHIKQSTDAKWSLHNTIPLTWMKRNAEVTKDFENVLAEMMRRM